ncbi:MAG: putative membrane protein, partial [uncultured Microvirga sp.]
SRLLPKPSRRRGGPEGGRRGLAAARHRLRLRRISRRRPGPRQGGDRRLSGGQRTRAGQGFCVEPRGRAGAGAGRDRARGRPLARAQGHRGHHGARHECGRDRKLHRRRGARADADLAQGRQGVGSGCARRRPARRAAGRGLLRPRPSAAARSDGAHDGLARHRRRGARGRLAPLRRGDRGPGLRVFAGPFCGRRRRDLRHGARHRGDHRAHRHARGRGQVPGPSAGRRARRRRGDGDGRDRASGGRLRARARRVAARRRVGGHRREL